MSQNDQTHSENVTANTARFLSVPDHFGILYIKY